MNKPETAILTAGTTTTTFDVPNELLPLLGRPLTQRAVETIVNAGIREIHVILGEAAETTEMLLGGGARWGCRIHYHDALSNETTSALVRRLGLRTDRLHLLADTAQLPVDMTKRLRGPICGAGEVWTKTASGNPIWTGWAQIQGEWLARCELPWASKSLASQLLADRAIWRREVAQALSAAAAVDLLRTADHLLADSAHKVTIGRRSQVHPTARLFGPVWVGQNVRIGREVQIGPGVSIGDGALIEAGSILSNAIILPGTFVGEGLAVKDAIAGGNRLASVQFRTVIDITDAHLLSHAAGKPKPGTSYGGDPIVASAAKHDPQTAGPTLRPRWRETFDHLLWRWTKTHCPDYANARSGTQRRTA